MKTVWTPSNTPSVPLLLQADRLTVVSTRYAKDNRRRCAAGNSGKPVARITALEPPKAPIRFGVLKNRIKVAKDFDAPLPEAILAAFEGR